MKKPWVVSYPLSAQRRLIGLDECPDWPASSLGAPAILLVLSCCGSNENSEDCVYPDQTSPSPVFTLFADVPFHRTLKTPFYIYLLFAVTVFLSYLLSNICIDFLKTELNYRELYPLAWEIWHPCSQSYGHCPIKLLGHWEYCHTLYAIHGKHCMLSTENACSYSKTQ